MVDVAACPNETPPLADRPAAEQVKAQAEQVHATFAELGIGAPMAKELTQTLSRYTVEPLSDEGVARRNVQTEAALRAEWPGGAYDENMRHACAAYGRAMERMPWLQKHLELGGGSDLSVIKAFAAAGRKLARGGRG